MATTETTKPTSDSTNGEMTAEKALAMTYSDSLAVEKIISAPVSVTFEKFHEYVWLKNGGLGPSSWTTIIAKGDEVTFEGETRSAAGIVREKILRTIPNKEIMYTVVSGPMPVRNHLGIVSFEAEGSDKTKVTWSVKYTPYMGAGLAVRALIKGVFKLFLHNLQKVITSKSSEPVMASPAEVAEAEAQTYTSFYSTEKIVSAPVPVAFRQFRDVVWLHNAGLGPTSWTYIVEEGDKDTHIGEVRKAAGVTDEKILHLVENEMIVYSVVKGPMPFHNHIGTVLFAPEGDDKTKITWSVKYSPMVGADVFVKGLLQTMFPLFLNRLEDQLTGAKTIT